jgi:hypothetical protein
MFLTLGEASKQSGFSKATLSRAIRDGKLSAQRSPETNSFKIDPAELHRYSEAMQVLRAGIETEREKHSATPSGNRESTSETEVETRVQEIRKQIEFEARAKLAEERLADLKGQLEEMRRQRDKWQEQAERLALAPPPPTPAPVQPQPRGWWPWRRSA